MKELLDQVRAWQAEGAGLGRAVVVRTFGSAPRPEGANLVVTADGRLAGSVSGGCVEGAAFDEIQRARADGVDRVIRYGISDEQAWDVGLACGGTIDVLVEPFVRPEVVEAAAGRGGVAVVIPLPADAPPAAFGLHAAGSRRGARTSVHRRRGWHARRIQWVARGRRGDRARGPRPAGPRRVDHGGGRRPPVVPRGVPGLAAPGDHRCRPGGDAALAHGARAGLRDRRGGRARGVRHDGAFPGRRRPRRRVARRGRRGDRPGSGRRGRRADSRRQVRRAGDRRGAAPRLSLRRRGRLAQDAGRPTGAPAGGRGGGGRPGTAARADRPRPRRAGAGGDGARDHGRDRGASGTAERACRCGTWRGHDRRRRRG